MQPSGWGKKYNEIVKEFGYQKEQDLNSAKLLNSLLQNEFSIKKLRTIIEKQSIFVLGAGPSLTESLTIIKKYRKTKKIVADGALKETLENGIKPDIITTDLDGDIKSLKKIGRTKVIMVVHAHGDNSDKLNLASGFKNCIGTTQTEPFGKIHNFGGFTDGDRAVFLASHFNAKNIILFGMDFDTSEGKFSEQKIVSKKTKLKKLKKGKMLLEWFADKSGSTLYTTSKPIKGFKKVHFKDLQSIISS